MPLSLCLLIVYDISGWKHCAGHSQREEAQGGRGATEGQGGDWKVEVVVRKPE